MRATKPQLAALRAIQAWPFGDRIRSFPMLQRMRANGWIKGPTKGPMLTAKGENMLAGPSPTELQAKVLLALLNGRSVFHSHTWHRAWLACKFRGWAVGCKVTAEGRKALERA